MSLQETDVGATNQAARRARAAGVGDGADRDMGIGISVPPSASSPTPAAHALRAGLVLEEIIHWVFKGVNPKRTLKNLALTNKADLFDPVMDRVWGTMHSLAPFFQLLPYDQTMFDGANKIVITMISNPATSNAIFMKYAKRLRHLAFEGGTTAEDVHLPSNVRLAFLQPPDTPLFPALESVTFASTEIGQHAAAYVELLPSCPVTRLAFSDLHVESATFVAVLSFFSLKLAESLAELKLAMPSSGKAFSMQSLHYITDLVRLQTLSITSQHPDFPAFDLLPWILGQCSLRDLEFSALVKHPLSHEYAELRSASKTFDTLRIGGDITFIGAVLPSFGGGPNSTGVQGTVVFSPSSTLHSTHKEQLTKFVLKNFPGQPLVRFK